MVFPNGPNTARDVSPPPTSRDVSPKQVKRVVFNQSIQQPAAMFPAVGAVVTGLFAALIITNPITVGAAVGLGFLAVAGFGFNYFIRGPRIAAQYVEGVMARIAAEERRPVQELIDGFASLGLDRGRKETRELEDAYRKCKGALNGRPDPKLEYLVDRSFEAGLGVLKNGLLVARSVRAVSVSKLQSELSGLREELSGIEKKIEKPKRADDSRRLESQRDSLQMRIDRLEKRIDRLHKQELLVERAFDESDRIEAELENAFVTMGTRPTADTFMTQSSTSAVDRLTAVINGVQELDRELQLGSVETELESEV